MRRQPVRTIIVATLAIVALAVLLTGCGSGLPSGDPSISGTIRQISTTTAGATILVVGGGSVDQASVRITSATRILVDPGSGAEAGTLSDIAAGASVRVWFTGPVAESYPVQATAGTLLVVR
jgi:uncharacterized protein DUF3221